MGAGAGAVRAGKTNEIALTVYACVCVRCGDRGFVCLRINVGV